MELVRGVGGTRREGVALCSLSQSLWCAGRVAREAVALLERLPAGRELASAYANLSQVSMNAEDAEGAAAWAERALMLAESLHETVIRTDALINRGAARY